MTRLSVNINKVALLRNSRGGNIPDVVAFARTCEVLGADGITVHPRPDGRHIRRADVYALRQTLTVELNVEGYPSPEFLELIEEVRPAQVTLVPDPPQALTSDHGWDISEHKSFLARVIQRLKAIPVRVSLFIDPVPDMVKAAQEVGADAVELYTGPYAMAYPERAEEAIQAYRATAQTAARIGMRLHAGHDLNLQNLHFLRRNLPNLAEVSIGHALIADALYMGIGETIRHYRQALTL